MVEPNKLLFAAVGGAFVGAVATYFFTASGEFSSSILAPARSLRPEARLDSPPGVIDEFSPGATPVSPKTPGPVARGNAGHTTEAGVDYFLSPELYVFQTHLARKGELRRHGLPQGADPEMAAVFMGLDSEAADGKISPTEIQVHLVRALPQLASMSIARLCVRAFDVGAGLAAAGGAVPDVAGDGALEWGEFQAFYGKCALWHKMWRNAAEKIFGALAIEKLTGVEVQEKELPITVLEDIFLATFDTPALRTAGSHAAIANICKSAIDAPDGRGLTFASYFRVLLGFAAIYNDNVSHSRGPAALVAALNVFALSFSS